MSFRRWLIAQSNRDLARRVAQRFGIDGFAAHLLTSRGFCTDEGISDMLGLDDDTTEFIDPFEIIDMDKAVSRISRAIDNFERIAVYGDYDVDGVTSTAMTYSYLESVGANVMYYIPDREGEGYGLNRSAIDILREKEINLIITVDNGISAVEEVAYAKSLGMDVVITDHHQEGDELPDAAAVVNPHRKGSRCRFTEYAGVGVAFKLICALEGDSFSVAENFCDLVALGTVADVVSLTGENRRLVRMGISQLQNTERLGLQTLIDMAGISGRPITATTIAFVIAPRLNAAGRLSSASHAVRLLITEDDEEAALLAEELTRKNRERQAIEQIIDSDVSEMLEKDQSLIYDRVIVIAGEKWNGGVIGIFASRICERYGKPCFIISYEGDKAKGSGRSIEGFSLHDAISACSEHLTGFGGHTLAAGINLNTDKIDSFRRAINEYAARKYPVMPSPVLRIDCQLPPSAITMQLCTASQLLEPFGADNPTPYIAVMGLKLNEIYGAGGGRHQRLTLERGGTVITAMKFNTAGDEFPFRVGDVVDIVITLDKSTFRGRETLTLVVRDIRLSETRFDEISSGRQLFEKMMRDETLSETELRSLRPTRAMLGSVYREVVSGYYGEADVLGCRLKRQGVGFAAMLTSLCILSEGGLISLFDAGDILEIDPVGRSGKDGRITPESTPTAMRVGYRNV
jgi:single-stranded-DNA-specific exonuclease RecJ